MAPSCQRNFRRATRGSHRSTGIIVLGTFRFATVIVRGVPTHRGRAVGEGRSEFWDAVYSGQEMERHSWYQAVPELSVAMIGRAGLERGDAVLDVGAGSSALAGLLARRGLRVTALDVSARAIALARLRAATDADAITWVVADFSGWEPDRRFRLVHDRAVFHFVTDPGERDAYLGRVRRLLEPGGQVVLTTFALDGPEACSGLAVARYDCAMLADLLGPGFRIDEVLSERHRTPAGREQRFSSIRARLRDEDVS